MDFSNANALITHFEAHPEMVPMYAKSLEATIAELMEATFRSNDPSQKTKLARMPTPWE